MILRSEPDVGGKRSINEDDLPITISLIYTFFVPGLNIIPFDSTALSPCVS